LRKVTVGDFHLGETEKAAIRDVLDSGRISEGPRVREFEQRWAQYNGVKHCVATSSGFGALAVGLQTVKYRRQLAPGAKVITSPLTYIADASAASMTSFTPVFVDIDPQDFCITPQAVRSHLESVPDPEAYAVLMPVDLMGYAVRIEEMREIADEFNLVLFEDAAQAHGTVHRGHRTGSQADMACYSFYIAHNVQAGEMGALITNDGEIADMARKIKAQGRTCSCRVCTRSEGRCPELDRHKDSPEDIDPRFQHDVIGFNFKTMEFQAALALTQMDHVDRIIEARRHNVRTLNESLAGYSEILSLPMFDSGVSYLAYPIVIRDEKLVSRKQLRQRLEAEGIETRPLFGCIPTQQPAYAYLKDEYEGRLPNAEYVGRNGFYVGCHQYLTSEDLDHIAGAFDRALSDVVR
jgi:perosamine synthetase